MWLLALWIAGSAAPPIVAQYPSAAVCRSAAAEAIKGQAKRFVWLCLETQPQGR